jgi:hypothetical protein
MTDAQYLIQLAERCLLIFRDDPLSPRGEQFALWGRELAEWARRLQGAENPAPWSRLPTTEL